jgi:hypothetical protein
MSRTKRFIWIRATEPERLNIGLQLTGLVAGVNSRLNKSLLSTREAYRERISVWHVAQPEGPRISAQALANKR